MGEVQELDETVKFSVMHTKLIQAKLVQAKSNTPGTCSSNIFSCTSPYKIIWIIDLPNFLKNNTNKLTRG